jgi:predicted nucleic acid-binding protein
MYLLDTDVLSEITKRVPNDVVIRRLHATQRDLLFASEMTRYELRYGAAIHSDPSGFWERVERKILPRATWIPIGPEVSCAAADLDAILRRKGNSIELPDVLIAATAQVYELVLVTRNVRHFEALSSLKIENWFSESATGS